MGKHYPTPKVARRGSPEAEIQKRVVAALRLARVSFFHVPNEGEFPPQYRAKLVRLGVQPGVPDLIIVTPSPAYRRPAALELKAPEGKPSDEQIAWRERFEAHAEHWLYACTHGLSQSLGMLKWWGYINDDVIAFVTRSAKADIL